VPDRKQEKDEHVLVKLTGKAEVQIDEESVEDGQEESKSHKSV
jgi:hypothetical protein